MSRYFMPYVAPSGLVLLIIPNPGRCPQVYTHLFAQGYERDVKNAMLRAVRAKARIGVCLHPSLKAGVNERQIVDNSVLLVSKLLVACVQTIRPLPQPLGCDS